MPSPLKLIWPSSLKLIGYPPPQVDFPSLKTTFPKYCTANRTAPTLPHRQDTIPRHKVMPFPQIKEDPFLGSFKRARSAAKPERIPPAQAYAKLAFLGSPSTRSRLKSNAQRNPAECYAAFAADSQMIQGGSAADLRKVFRNSARRRRKVRAVKLLHDYLHRTSFSPRILALKPLRLLAHACQTPARQLVHQPGSRNGSKDDRHSSTAAFGRACRIAFVQESPFERPLPHLAPESSVQFLRQSWK